MTEAEMLERIHIQGKFLALNEENKKLVLQKIREMLEEQEGAEHENQTGC